VDSEDVVEVVDSEVGYQQPTHLVVTDSTGGRGGGRGGFSSYGPPDTVQGKSSIRQ